MTEKYGNLFNFDPTLYNVVGTPIGPAVDSAGGTIQVINSGFVVAGNSPNATPNTTNSTLSGRQWGLSPRVAFAWAPKRDGGRFVVRGGFGLYYDRGEYFQYLSQPAGSSTGGPFGVTESAPLVTVNGTVGSSLSSPIGTFSNPTGLASAITGSLQHALDLLTGPGHAGTNGAATGGLCSAIDSEINDECSSGSTLNLGVYNKYNKLPYTMNFNLNLQYQFTKDLAISFGYTGNRGRHAVLPLPLNEPQIATTSSPAMIGGATPHSSGETATYGVTVLNLDSSAGVTSKYGTAVNPIQHQYWNTYDGGNTDVRTPYIGFNPNATSFTASGVSAYDALETHLEKRLSHMVSLGANYTFSRTHDEQSDLGLFFTGNDPNNLRTSYGLADFDRTHVFAGDFEVDLPDYMRKGAWESQLTNGWHMNGITILQSGEPYSLYEFDGAVGSVRFGNFPDLLNPVLPVADKNKALTGNTGNRRLAGGAYQPAIDPSQIAIPSVTPGTMGVPLNTSGPHDTYETGFVSGQRNIFRQAAQRRLDLSFRKDFHIHERFALVGSFNVFNVTNTPSFDVPQNTTTIRQHYACSTVSGAESTNCGNLETYGAVGTTAADQATNGGRGTAGAAYDKLPTQVGTGAATTIPVSSSSANFGSITDTIGSNRIITWGLRVTY